MREALRRRCPSGPTSGRMRWREYRRISGWESAGRSRVTKLPGASIVVVTQSCLHKASNPQYPDERNGNQGDEEPCPSPRSPGRFPATMSTHAELTHAASQEFHALVDRTAP